MFYAYIFVPGVSWEVLLGPWGVPVGPWGSLGTPGPPLRIPWVVPEGLQGIAGRFLGVPGPPRESLRGPWEYLVRPRAPPSVLRTLPWTPWTFPKDHRGRPQTCQNPHNQGNQESTILVASVQGYLGRSLGSGGSLGVPGHTWATPRDPLGWP